MTPASVSTAATTLRPPPTPTTHSRHLPLSAPPATHATNPRHLPLSHTPTTHAIASPPSQDHDCKCELNGYECRELSQGIWTDTCIDPCTDGPVSSEGCYDKEAHRCDCDVSKAECEAKGDGHNWSDGCNSCMGVDGTRVKGFTAVKPLV